MKGTDTVAIGATESFAATVKPSVKVSYKSDATDVATVDAKGTVTGVKEGTATITATAKVGTKTVKASKKVEIVNAITAKATTPKKIDVTFAGAIEKADKANFTVTDNKGATALIKSVTLDATKKIVTVEFYSALTSGNTYTIVAKNGEKSYQTTVDFKKGVVTTIEAANQLVLAGTSSAIKYTVRDENGLDITEGTRVNVQCTTVATPNTTADAWTVNLADKVVAYATVVYTEPTTGKQVKSEQFTITGATSIAASVDAIAISGSSITTWPTKDIRTTTTMGSHEYLTAQYTDIYGAKKVTSAGATSLNPEILIVDSSNGLLTPVKEGTATVAVKVNDVTTNFTVTVNAAQKATSLAVDASSKTTTTLTTLNGVATPAKIKINVMDQSGVKMTTSAAVTFKLTSGVNVVSAAGTTMSAINATVAGTTGTDTVFAPVGEGTAWFEVSLNGQPSVAPIYVSVTVGKANNTIVGYKFADVAKDYDMNGDHTTPAATTTSAVKLYAVNASGEKVDIAAANKEVVSGATITLTNNTTKAVTTLGTTDENGAISAALSAVTGGNIADEGTYTLTATKNGTTLDSITLTVKDSSTKPVVTAKTTAYTATAATVALTDILDLNGFAGTITNVTFTSSNSAFVATPSSGSPVTSISYTGTGSATLYNIVATVTATGTGRTYTVKVETPITISK